MRKLTMLATMVALVVAMMALSAVPAFAANNVRVNCENNQTQILTLLSEQNSRQCNNIGNNQGNSGGGENESGSSGSGGVNISNGNIFGSFNTFGGFSFGGFFPCFFNGTATVCFTSDGSPVVFI